MLGLLFLCGVAAQAQKNDLGVTFGGYFTADNPLSAGTAFAIEGSYARQFFAVPALQLSVEVPVAASFDSFVPSSLIPVIGNSYTSVFVTPGVRARLAPSFFLSPYVAVGVGLAHFNNSLTGGGSSSDNSFAVDFGGGLDLKIFPHVSLRAEVRDFYTGSPGLDPLFLQKQNNLVVTGGVGIRF
jgi:opacity protein-like surface antigen